jgi:amicoumacin kinase
MDPIIAARFNDSILQEALQCYEIPPDSARKLDGFESFIYEFSRPDGDYILRIGHSSRRTPDLIRAEVDWINYLAAHGTTVARAVLSRRANLVEPLADGDGGEFLCTAFVRAPGSGIRAEQANERLFRNYGRLLGRMHALAKNYTPTNSAWKRYAWDSPENNTTERQLPAGQASVLQKYHRLMTHLRSLPCDPNGYGMIHQDAHPGNFFVDEDYTITLFDFDDCVYGHFIYDIAMVLFYTSMGEQDPSAYTGRFMPVFLSGYREENHLDPYWLKELPHFMKLREIDLYAAILFSFGPEPEDRWCANYLNGRRFRIGQDVPYIEFDWDSLNRYL